MALTTRYYFSHVTASPISPAFQGSWDATGSALRRKLLPLASLASSDLGTVNNSETSTSPQNLLCYQHSTAALTAGTLTGDIKIVMQARESQFGADAIARAHAFLVAADGSTVLATLGTATNATELGITEASRTLTITLGSSVTVPEGAYLCVETGTRHTNTSATSTTSIVRVQADPGYTDHTFTDGESVGSKRGWIEFTTTTASLYMPDVQVEIAFNAGVRTPAADRVWTDVSVYAELDRGVDVDAWRADEFSTCDANTLRLTLDNRDGRFTPGRAASPYYPNVKIGRPIRVTATPVGGSASVRFVGFIDEWPLEWDGSDQNAYAQVTATSRLARLGNDRKLRSIVEEEILADSPAAYYTFGEATGATSAADSSGNGEATLTQAGTGTAVTFGTATGPGTDGLTAATFAGGKYLSGVLGGFFPLGVGFTLEAFVAASSPGTNAVIVGADTNGAIAHLRFSATGTVIAGLRDALGATTDYVTSAASISDGNVHHVAAVWNDSTFQVSLYVDGVLEGTQNTTIAPPAYTLYVGGAPDMVSITGTLAHAVAFSTTPTGTRIAAHAGAGRTGFVGETPGTRFARYASYADILAAEVDADAGTSPMAHIDTTDKTVLELLRTVETTEGGVLFDGRDGTLEFRGRSSRYLATSAFTLSVTSQQVEAGMSPKLDRSAIQNDVTATITDSTVTAHAVNSTSVNDYGAKGDDIELATTDVNEPHSAAWWRVNTYAEPTSRVPALTVDVLALSAATQALVLAAEPGTRFTVTGLPSQSASSTGDYFVEGVSESMGPESYFVTFNVSDATPYVNTLVLDSATRGLLDTNRLAY